MNSSRSKQRYLGAALAAVAVTAAVAGCGHKDAGGGAGGAGGGTASGAQAQTPSTSVYVQPVRTGSVSQTIQVVGSLQTLYDVELSPVTAGQLVNVFVREGDTVHAGQVLAQTDPTVAQAEVRQDQANLLSDQAKVDQAQAQYEQAVINAQVAIRNAKSSLAAAKIDYSRTKTGDVALVKQQAGDQEIQQQANYQNALDAFNREAYLYKNGAAALADYQNAQTQLQTQKAILAQYKANYANELSGGRPEDVAAANETVLQSKANLQNAYANQGAVNVDKQAIVAAKATVAQAQAMLESANKDLQDTNLVSPINGVVSARNADPGQLAQPGTSVLEVVDLRTMYYQPTVSEDQFRQIGMGQQVTISVDAYPGATFHGQVTQIYPSASASNRQFSIRVSIPNDDGRLRPGMYARGVVTTATHRNVIVVPVSALQPQVRGTGYSVNDTSNGIATGSATIPPQEAFIVGADSKAEIKNLTIGIDNGTVAEVTSGLKVGDQLIVKGQGTLQDGDRVRVESPHGKRHAPA